LGTEKCSKLDIVRDLFASNFGESFDYEAPEFAQTSLQDVFTNKESFMMKEKKDQIMMIIGVDENANIEEILVGVTILVGKKMKKWKYQVNFVFLSSDPKKENVIMKFRKEKELEDMIFYKNVDFEKFKERYGGDVLYR